jgi:hypothetical protein
MKPHVADCRALGSQRGRDLPLFREQGGNHPGRVPAGPRTEAGQPAGRLLPGYGCEGCVHQGVDEFDASVALVVPELGKSKNATNAKARRVLGWAPRSNQDSIVATAESLVRLGLLRKPIKAV